jgi:hypothetical protein
LRFRLSSVRKLLLSELYRNYRDRSLDGGGGKA